MAATETEKSEGIWKHFKIVACFSPSRNVWKHSGGESGREPKNVRKTVCTIWAAKMLTWKLLDISISHMDKEEGQGWAAANTPLHTVCAKFIKESQGQCNTFQLYTRDSAWSVFHSFQRDCLVNMMLRIRPRISFQTAAAARLPVSHETSSFRSLEQDSRTLMHWNRKCLYRLSGTAMCSQSDSCWNQILSLFQKL